MTTPITVGDHETLRSKGNESFKQKDFTKALSFYTDAIAARRDDTIAYLNRAICYINLKRYYEAIEDCNTALALDDTLIKAYYRRALAQKELFRFRLALDDYEKVFDLDPDFALAKEEITKLNKILNSDPRIDIKCYHKPTRFKSTREMQEFDLKNQYIGAKIFII